ncbi:MAG: hypothetical protein KC464_01705, partial [Myxococcales bacterium]|nr:hypothetical protein [Myxococcales bacterium]
GPARHPPMMDLGPPGPPAPAPQVPTDDELPLLLDPPARPAPTPGPAPIPGPERPVHPRDRERSQPNFAVAQAGDHGPYAFAGYGSGLDDNGVSFGVGLAHGHDGSSTYDLGIQGGIGHHEDLDGNQYEGLFHLHGGLRGDAHDEDMPGPGSPLYDGAIDGGGPSFDVGIYDDGDTFNFGAQAGIADAAMQLGTTPSADRDADTSVRLGGSEGVGFGGRIHHGDADGDGIAEGGFGIDAGPLSLDVRSELIGRAWNWVTQ